MSIAFRSCLADKIDSFPPGGLAVFAPALDLSYRSGLTFGAPQRFISPVIGHHGDSKLNNRDGAGNTKGENRVLLTSRAIPLTILSGNDLKVVSREENTDESRPFVE
ncbi:hypothetical protein ElyMa_006513700 [Elysia marginata]|uniref:Uncharacterized protein n=1 Tax=Elysia marginata TaxID=1093978 RepID=A0AAV4I432_9GAST|nr:hypothetical protein ElyMa_006513700 [Elysia marginata]